MLATKFATRALLLAMILAADAFPQFLRQASAQDNTARRLSAVEFENLHRKIKPQAGESRWMEVAWFLDLHEARRKAATEGKPLFIYSSGGATGIGAC